MNRVYGEIEYTDEDGEQVHSDIGPPEGKFSNIDEKYRKFLHEVLDEWLDKSKGTGTFYVESEKYERNE